MEIRSWLSPRRRQREQAHAYLDGELSPSAKARFEAALARDAALAADVAQLRAIKHATARLPGIEAPRSFRLTAAMVAAPARPAPAPVRTPARALRLAQGVAALSLFALSVTFVAGALGGAGDKDDSAASAESAALTAQDLAGKSAIAPSVANAGTNDTFGGDAGGSRSTTAVTPSTVPAFNPTLPPYSPTSPVTGQAVTATPDTSATAVASPTPRAPATGPGSDVTPALPTPVPPSTGGSTGGGGAPIEGASTPFAFNPTSAYAADGVTGSVPAPDRESTGGGDGDGPGAMRLTQAALGAVAIVAIGTASVIALRRRRLS